MNYFAKTVYTITTKTCPLAVYRRFSQAKSEGPKWALLKSEGPWPPGPPVPLPLQFRRLQFLCVFSTALDRALELSLLVQYIEYSD